MVSTLVVHPFRLRRTLAATITSRPRPPTAIPRTVSFPPRRPS